MTKVYHALPWGKRTWQSRVSCGHQEKWNQLHRIPPHSFLGDEEATKLLLPVAYYPWTTPVLSLGMTKTKAWWVSHLEESINLAKCNLLYSRSWEAVHNLTFQMGENWNKFSKFYLLLLGSEPTYLSKIHTTLTACCLCSNASKLIRWRRHQACSHVAHEEAESQRGYWVVDLPFELTHCSLGGAILRLYLI